MIFSQNFEKPGIGRGYHIKIRETLAPTKQIGSDKFAFVYWDVSFG